MKVVIDWPIIHFAFFIFIKKRLFDLPLFLCIQYPCMYFNENKHAKNKIMIWDILNLTIFYHLKVFNYLPIYKIFGLIMKRWDWVNPPPLTDLSTSKACSSCTFSTLKQQWIPGCGTKSLQSLVFFFSCFPSSFTSFFQFHVPSSPLQWVYSIYFRNGFSAISVPVSVSNLF